MKNLIPASELCERYNVEISFLHILRDKGLIEITISDESECLGDDQLVEFEKIINLYYDLDINIEGIETINHLLTRIRQLQDEITRLKNRLDFYENES